MGAGTANACPNCERLQRQVQALQELAARQQQAVAALTEQVRLLQDKLAAAAKDSSTSSKPPSSDIVKPPKPEPPPGQDRRNIGGQPGHPRHQRAAFPEAQVNGGFFDHTLECCPDCGHAVQPLDGPPRVAQQMDVLPPPVVVQEHRGHPAWCPKCLKVHYAALPASVESGGLIGPNLTVLIAYLKGICHASFSTVRKFLRDVARVTISRGQLAKVIAKVSDALAGPYGELLRALPSEPILNVDETGHKDSGQRLWTWCFRAELYTLFKVDPSRSAEVLVEVLGKEFNGVLGCDHFSAYRRYMREFDVRVQFCLAHLIREVKFLTTLPNVPDVLYGVRLQVTLEGLFKVIHRREQVAAGEFARQLQEARERVLKAGLQDTGTEHSRRLAKRFKKYGADYFTFITTPGLEPTNNAAERAIRFVVIDRLVTQGTRSETGQRWSERMWTAVATCAQRGWSVFEYLQEAVRAHFGGGPAPSLLGAQG
jgi:transposase